MSIQQVLRICLKFKFCHERFCLKEEQHQYKETIKLKHRIGHRQIAYHCCVILSCLHLLVLISSERECVCERER